MCVCVCGLCARLHAVGTALTDSAHQSISGQKQSAKVEPGSVYMRVTSFLPCNAMSALY